MVVPAIGAATTRRRVTRPSTNTAAKRSNTRQATTARFYGGPRIVSSGARQRHRAARSSASSERTEADALAASIPSLGGAARASSASSQAGQAHIPCKGRPRLCAALPSSTSRLLSQSAETPPGAVPPRRRTRTGQDCSSGSRTAFSVESQVSERNPIWRNIPRKLTAYGGSWTKCWPPYQPH